MYNPFSISGKTILITGAGGGIGRATAIECSKMGANVVITDINTHALEETLSTLDVQDGQEHMHFVADLTNEVQLEELVAAVPVLDGLVSNAGISKVLPIWKYSVDKWASEQKIAKLFEGSDVKYTIIRPCVTYGDTRIPYGISPIYGYHWTLAARILAGKPIITWNGGLNRCNMTRVEDFAVGVVGLIGNEKAYGEAFNVCGDEASTFRDVLDVLSEYLHKEVITVDVKSEFYANELPSRAGEILGGRSIDTINSNIKLKAAVPAFKQTYSLKDGVIKTLDAYKAQGYQYGIDWKFDGDTDRIIKKWCNKIGLDAARYKIDFMDYLGTANSKDKRDYRISFEADSITVKLYKKMQFICALPGRIIRKLKRMI